MAWGVSYPGVVYTIYARTYSCAAWYQPFAHVQEFYRKLCNLYSFSKFEFPSACYVTSDDVMPKSLLEVEPVLA